MVNYNLDSLQHTLSSMTLYSIIRGFSAYFVNIGMPISVSRILPFLLANTETIFMIIAKSEAYTFKTRSLLFVFYAILKSSMFLFLPFLEDYILSLLKNGEVENI